MHILSQSILARIIQKSAAPTVYMTFLHSELEALPSGAVVPLRNGVEQEAESFLGSYFGAAQDKLTCPARYSVHSIEQ